MKKEEILKLIDSLHISSDEFYVLSSSALVIRGLFPDAGDLDIAITEKGLEQLKEKFNLRQKENDWYIVNDKVECIVTNITEDKVEKIGDYYLQSLDNYFEYLQASNREKDKIRYEIVKKALEERKYIKVKK